MLHKRLRYLWWTTFVLAFLCLTVHFVILFIYAMPLNPIQYTYSEAVTAYSSPFFYQNWRFFAPNPVSSNIVVSARATFPSPNQSTKLRYTPWKDLTDPVITAVQQNRFTELQIPELMLSNAAISLVNKGAYTPGSELYQAISHKQYPPEYMVLVRYACYIMKQTYPQVHFEDIQLSITETQPPDFLHYTSNNNKVSGVSIFPPMKYVSVA